MSSSIGSELKVRLEDCGRTRKSWDWIPACAGMTGEDCSRIRESSAYPAGSEVLPPRLRPKIGSLQSSSIRWACLGSRHRVHRAVAGWSRCIAMLLSLAAASLGFAQEGTSDNSAGRGLALMTDHVEIGKAVELMTPSERELLRRKREKFASENKQKQRELRDFHQAIVSDSDSERLYRVMTRYYEWLGTLTDIERAELLDLPRDERIERIRQWKQRQTGEWLENTDLGITPADARAVRDFFRKYVDKNKRQLRAQLPPKIQRSLADSRNNPRRQLMLLGSAVIRGDVQLPAPTPKAVEKLESRLSKKALEIWKHAGNENARRELLRRWMRVILRSHVPSISNEALEEFYLTRLTPKQRDELNRLPPEQLREQLRHLYIRTERDWRTGSGRSRRDVPRGPRRDGRGSGRFESDAARGAERGRTSGPRVRESAAAS